MPWCGDLAGADGAGVRGPLVSQHVSHLELRELAGHPGRNLGPKRHEFDTALRDMATRWIFQFFLHKSVPNIVAEVFFILASNSRKYL